MPRNQAPPEEFESSRRGGAAGREHHEPEPDGRIDRAVPKRNDLDDEDSIGRPHPSRRDEDDEDALDGDFDDGDLDQVSSPGRSAGAGRAPDREAEANALGEADIVEEIDLDDLEDDDLMPMDGPDDPDA